MNFSNPECLKKGKDTFYRLQNNDGKVWFLPSKNLKTALQIYQPSGKTGKILKNFLPWLHKIRLVRNKLNISQENLELNKELLDITKKVFKTDKVHYSLFCGTPSVHQKITIQFFMDNNILGYCKISENPDVKSLFLHENKILDTLKDLNVSGIPLCLYCREKNNQGIFIQSTKKTSHSYSPSYWTPLHSQFIEELRVKTIKPVLFEESDLYSSLKSLKSNINLLPPQFADIISSHLDKVITEHIGKTMEYSAFHADFTPWNMFIDKGQIFVFDWEYAQLTYPPLLDKYHFHIQQMIHVKHWEPEKIMEELKKEEWVNIEQLRLYLLDIISRFVGRGKGSIDDSLRNSLQIWTSLLSRL